jgi:hypothetical protein
LLYADDAGLTVIQGWELKFPDTSVNDLELLASAERKARALGLNSFLVWNVSEAVLYVRTDEDEFAPTQNWSVAPGLRNREDVRGSETEWRAIVPEIVLAVSQLTDEGTLRRRPVTEAFGIDGVVSIILDNVPVLTTELRDRARDDGDFEAWVNVWWRASRVGYAEETPWVPLARMLLTLWVTRIVFAHVLRAFATAANEIAELRAPMTEWDARELLTRVSDSVDFLAVLRVPDDDPPVDPRSWSQLVELNEFLSSLDFRRLPQELVHQCLQQLLQAGRRKAAGQFVTPRMLARFLVLLTIRDPRGQFIDPFCGTGTIAREAAVLKESTGQSWAEAMSSTWASDKFRFPVHLATLAMAEPESIGTMQQVFLADATELFAGRAVQVLDPTTGEPVDSPLPAFSALASNLPFVQFEDVDVVNPGIRERYANEFAGTAAGLAAKSDLYAYLLIFVKRLLRDDARVGVILSNSWLGTGWGDDLRRELDREFRVSHVILSKAGRWFSETDVVTTIVLMQVREAGTQQADSEEVVFAATELPLREWNDEVVAAMSADVRTGRAEPGVISLAVHSRTSLEAYEAVGLAWSAAFADISWIHETSPVLVPASELFVIARGERRGWDALFYPRGEAGIEEQYLRPVLLSSQSVAGMIASPDALAFSCDVSEDDLRRRGHTGALAWIERFRHSTNQTGMPLPEVLATGGRRWYSMRPDAQADLVSTINPGDRLFVARMSRRGFVNQRLTRFLARDNTDITLCHALLNSVVGMFWLEGLGFGRGLGALDLSSTRLRDGLQILDPSKLNSGQRREILRSFEPLLARDVMAVPIELGREDRRAFDEVVLNAYGLQEVATRIRDSLITLYDIRHAVLD